MRVIGGISRGRKLSSITGDRIRPTADRAREDIFNIIGNKIKKAKVLDMFAGTGALGIESLSRGAEKAFFLDLDCTVIHKNIGLCRFEDKAVVISTDIIRLPFPRIVAHEKFDFIFLDPPYGKEYIEKILNKEGFMDFMSSEAIVIAEHGFKESFRINSCLDIFRQKKYSNTIISFIRHTLI